MKYSLRRPAEPLESAVLALNPVDALRVRLHASLNRPSNDDPIRRRSVVQRLDDLFGHLLRVAEQHHRVRPEEQFIVDTRVA